MSSFVLPTDSPKPKSKNVQSISLLFAGALVALALAQLFSFEDFPAQLIGAGISPYAAPLLATIIVCTEVLALPFALRMRLSPAFRVLSMIAGWVAIGLLLKVAVIETIAGRSGVDAVFGATLTLPTGIWTICAVLALAVLAGWTSWGMWPLRKK